VTRPVGDRCEADALRAGALVRVRAEEEILSTLDASGRLDGMPFMPEMLRHCGEIHRVFKRADKTCDSMRYPGIRRMEGAVFLVGLRCDGSAHGGCQADCLFFWKEEWLIAADDREEQKPPAPSQPDAAARVSRGCAVDDLDREPRGRPAAGVETFSCQATELRKATRPLPPSEFGQYVRDVRSGNVGLGHVISVFSRRTFRWARRRLTRETPRQAASRLQREPPTVPQLQPGDRVQVRSRVEIEATLDSAYRNRGLSFNDEMHRYCGGEFRVLKRIERVIDEPTGRMITLRDCTALDDVTCRGDSHRFCPRDVRLYWREAWLSKLD
jgi:hypothetical protein